MPKNKFKNIFNHIANDVSRIYPYFLAFYLFSLLMSLFFENWKLFFYWPAFHLSAIFFGVLTLFSEKFKKTFLFQIISENLCLKEFKFKINLAHFDGKKFLFFLRAFIFYLRDAILSLINFLRSFSSLNLKSFKKNSWEFIFFLGKTIFFLLSYFIQSAKSLAKISRSFFLFAAIAIFSFLIVLNDLIKNFFVVLKISVVFLFEKLKNLDKKIYLKIFIMAVIFAFAFYQKIEVIDFLVLLYGLTAVLFMLNSRVSAGIALALLVSLPFFLIFKQEPIAEKIAVYAYYFLVISVATQITQYFQEKKQQLIHSANFD